MLVMFIAAFSSLVVGCTSSAEDKNSKQLVVYLGCRGDEANDDALYSAESLNDTLTTLGINVLIEADTTNCGYLLRWGTRERGISSVLTNVELLEECERFFGF